MKLLLLNTTANTGSTGRIAEEIGLLAQQSGYEVRFAYGRKAVNSKLPLFKIGNKWDMRWHGVKSRFWDAHGFGSRHATKALIRELEVWKPDIVNIHNLHGYYINIELLFEYLKRVQVTVVWTFHDCWPFTGHCSHFERVGCDRWKTECYACPNRKGYPTSFLVDRSTQNFRIKKEIFNGINNLTIVTPSQWLANHVANSFLSQYPVKLIHNGVDLKIFKPFDNSESIRNKYGLSDKSIVLGVANTWKKRKALQDFIALSEILDKDIQIVLVGMTAEQSKGLPKNIKAIARTENQQELAALYSAAAVFVNPTYVDNFPTTNIEALACGTPVITYRTGGSTEAVDGETGIVVEKDDVAGLKKAIESVVNNGKEYYRDKCRERAVRLYNKEDRFNDYIQLFDHLLLKN
jgi:glycosyltransferase involved in cell wall biosynthesis